MAFIISNNEDVFRKAKSWNADPNKAPKLRVEYTVNVSRRAGLVLDRRHVPDGLLPERDELQQPQASRWATAAMPTRRCGSETSKFPRGRSSTTPASSSPPSRPPADTGYMRIIGEKRLSPPTFSLSQHHRGPASTTDALTPRPQDGLCLLERAAAWRHRSEYYSSVDIKSVDPGDRRPGRLGHKRQVHGFSFQPPGRVDLPLRLVLRRRPQQGAAPAHRVRAGTGRGCQRACDHHAQQHRARPLLLRGQHRREPALRPDQQRRHDDELHQHGDLLEGFGLAGAQPTGGQRQRSAPARRRTSSSPSIRPASSPGPTRPSSASPTPTRSTARPRLG